MANNKYTLTFTFDDGSTIKTGPFTIPEGPAIIDNLTSTSTTAALSANQGRVLNEKIDAAIQAAIQNTWNGEY